MPCWFKDCTNYAHSQIKLKLLTDTYTTYNQYIICNQKVFEKLLYFILYSYIDTNKLLSTSQYGFWEGMSTELAIKEKYYYQLHKSDQELLTCSIFLDLSKAFDTVNQGCGVIRSRRFLVRVGFLTTMGVSVGFFCPTLDVQLHQFLHHTPKLGIPVEMVQFLLKLLLEQRFLAVHCSFYWF